jgi:hypothetical protein
MAAYYYKMTACYYNNMFPGQQFFSVCRPSPQESWCLGFIKPQMNLRIYHKTSLSFRLSKVRFEVESNSKPGHFRSSEVYS